MTAEVVRGAHDGLCSSLVELTVWKKKPISHLNGTFLNTQKNANAALSDFICEGPKKFRVLPRSLYPALSTD